MKGSERIFCDVSDCFISDTPFSVPDVSGLLESDTPRFALAERQDERSDCIDGASELVILVVLVIVCCCAAVWVTVETRISFLDHFL